MGRPKKNKKAEMKARRKTRKKKEHIQDLQQREKRARAYLKILSENAEVLQKLAEAEATESQVPSDALAQDAQSTQSPSV